MMRRHVKKASLLFVLLLGLAAILISAGISPRSEARQGNDVRSRIALLDAKARLARSGDAKAVNALADEVIQQFSSPEMKGAMGLFKDRLVSAEVNYRRQSAGGISERAVVDSLNELTERIGAPGSAKVSMAQLRYLRVNLLGVFPSFIGQSTNKETQKSAINPEMSPLEAAGMTMLMITQKQSNREFQVTPEEWADNMHRKSVAKWEAHKNGSAVAPKEAKPAIVVESAKSNELKQAFVKQGAAILPLIESGLDRMGIPREGGGSQ